MKKLKNTLFLLSAFSFAFVSCSKDGCTDPSAYNYNAEADKDDGSCTYEGCTDPAAVNYNPNATISSECIYDQIGSWTSTYQEVSGDMTASIGGFPVFDTSFTQITHPDSLEPSGLDFIADGSLYVYSNTEPTDTGSWSRTNDDLTLNMDDTTLVFNIDTIDGTFMRIKLEGSESEVDSGMNIDYNYEIKMEFNRN
ncbi:MAG: hypothetical protein CL846_03975 [Crocinitomicaceae bacterium]|nr:hypothetical protein [Crocinitomicaceae bacterium]|tara:strand:+ start:1886 stop:2473 length:588 start_codon:yes stop_codon:yes gene_type:complete